MVHQETLGVTNQQNQRTWSEEYWTYPKHDVFQQGWINSPMSRNNLWDTAPILPQDKVEDALA